MLAGQDAAQIPWRVLAVLTLITGGDRVREPESQSRRKVRSRRVTNWHWFVAQHGGLDEANASFHSHGICCPGSQF